MMMIYNSLGTRGKVLPRLLTLIDKILSCSGFFSVDNDDNDILVMQYFFIIYAMINRCLRVIYFA